MPQFAPDASETLIRRTREWQTLNREEIRANLLIAQQEIAEMAIVSALANINSLVRGVGLLIQADPVALEIDGIINADPDALRQRECRRVLHMFVVVAAFAPRFAAILASTPMQERRAVCDRLDKRLTQRLNAGDVIEPTMKAQVVDFPDMVSTLLQQAMGMVRMKWEGFATDQVKTKFVRDIFNSPKGYSKTERDIFPWEAPADFSFPRFMDDWLQGTVNASPYDARRAGATKTRRQWLADEHAAASADERKGLWISLATRLAGALEDYDTDALLAQLNANRQLLKQSVAPSVAPGEIDTLIDTNLRGWWSAFF
jgi:hypothetical protein